MVLDGALHSLKVLVFLSRYHDGDFVEAEVLSAIDAWVRKGGIVIYPLIRSNAVSGPATVEGNYAIFNAWRAGDTGKGKVILIDALREPLDQYIDDISHVLTGLDVLDPLTQTMLSLKKPDSVYASVLENRILVLYNNDSEDADVDIAGRALVRMPPISISTIDLEKDLEAARGIYE
jgi:hypothetical protein